MPFTAKEQAVLPTQDLLSWIFDDPQYDQDLPIYIDAARPSRSISCRQAKSQIRRIAAGLQKAGLQKGDCVCMHAFNDIEFPVTCLGVVAAGGVFTGTNPAYKVGELLHHIKVARVRFWIVEPDLLPAVRKACAEGGIHGRNIYAFDALGQTVPDGIQSWKTLQNHGEADWERFNDLETARSTPAVRLFSSGTTGLPKAMDLSHYGCTSQHTITHEFRRRPFPIRRLVPVPMFLVAQVTRTITSALRTGVQTYIMRRFEVEPWLSNIGKYDITELHFVPTMVVNLLKSGLLDKYPLTSVKMGMCGSAPLDKTLQLRFKKFFSPEATFNQTWGMSETGGNGMYFYYPEQDMTGSVGRVLPNHEVKIIDDDGNEITEPGVRGELCERGPAMFMGYFDGEKIRKDSYDEDGFFRTGDIACFEGSSQKWYIVDRKKSLIKVRGFQVSPNELEGVLLLHPDIADAAVIGVQQSIEESEFPRAYLVLRPHAKPTEETKGSIRAYMKERLASYKQLEGGMVFVDALPKNANSKVTKNVLKEQAKREMGARL